MTSQLFGRSTAADDPLTLSSLGSEKRIPHLETNSYIYQGASLGYSPSLASDRYSRPLVSPRLSHESLREAIDRRIVDKDLQYRSVREDDNDPYTLEGKMQTLDSEIARQLERSRVRELEEKVARRQDAESRDRIRTIEQTIDERSRAESAKSLRSPARHSLPLEESTAAYESADVSRNRSKSTKRSGSKYEFINDKYSKFNTKSPYAKSTFSHDVRSMENKTYTFLRRSADPQPQSRPSSKAKSSRLRQEEELQFLRKVLALAEAHAKRCPDLRIELSRVRRQFGQAD